LSVKKFMEQTLDNSLMKKGYFLCLKCDRPVAFFSDLFYVEPYHYHFFKPALHMDLVAHMNRTVDDIEVFCPKCNSHLGFTYGDKDVMQEYMKIGKSHVDMVLEYKEEHGPELKKEYDAQVIKPLKRESWIKIPDLPDV